MPWTSLNEHARNALLQRLSHVWRIDAREVLGRERLHHGRNLVAVEAEPGYRRGGDNLECGNLGRHVRPVLRHALMEPSELVWRLGSLAGPTPGAGR